MFDIGWSEMAIVMLVALIVIGPKDLPRVARNVGRWVAKGRALARDFQNQLEDMAREAELDKVKSEIEKAGKTDLKRSIERTVDPEGDLGTAFDVSAEKNGKKGEKSGAKGKPKGGNGEAPAPSDAGSAATTATDSAKSAAEPSEPAEPAAPPAEREKATAR